jgi:hypothetical protein
MTEIMLFRALSFFRQVFFRHLERSLYFFRHPERSLRSEGSRPPRSGGAIGFNQLVGAYGDRPCE